MKRKYKAPRVEIKDVEVEDIIATSPNEPDTGFDGGDFDLGGMGSDDLLP